MCGSQDEAKVGKEMAWKQGDDVQSEDTGKFGAKTRFFVSKCRFTHRTATLAFGSRPSRAVPILPESLHVPPPDLLRTDYDCLLGCVRLRYFADRSASR
jgi:hypothetical protein